MYLFFAPSLIALAIIAVMFMVRDLNAFTARQLRFAAKYTFALVVLVLTIDRLLSAIGR